MELIINSLIPYLNKIIEDTIDSLEEMEQGGLTFVKILLDEIFIMRNYVISGIHKSQCVWTLYG